MPTLAETRDVALSGPVGPADCCPEEAPSEVAGLLVPRVLRSKCSTSGRAGFTDAVPVLANRPTTRTPSTVVVTDGATIDDFLALTRPECAFTGEALSTPAKEMMPAVAEVALLNLHV